MEKHIFISHANNALDNEFTQWLALRLAREGYQVWCDLTRLLGGEYHWVDIEEAIRSASKFIYVLTDESNNSSPDNGEMKELSVAREIARARVDDFVIPARIESLNKPLTIHLRGITSTDFSGQGWARGLSDLLEKLEQDEVPKSNSGPNTVAGWWRQEYSATRGVLDSKETYFSNWFPMLKLPDEIYFHSLSKSEVDRLPPKELPFPGFFDEVRLVSFARLDDLVEPTQLLLERQNRTTPFTLTHLLNGGYSRSSIKPYVARDAVVRLTGLAWESLMESKSLIRHEMAGGVICYCFPHGFSDGDKVTFNNNYTGRNWRQLVGKHKGKFWHFGVSAKPLLKPLPCILLKPHVLFSDDGSTIWSNSNRLHKTRRRLCKNWWNDDWRDRILAAMTWISGDSEYIELSLGHDLRGDEVVLKIRTIPVTFESPISYAAPGERITLEYEEEDDDDIEDVEFAL